MKIKVLHVMETIGSGGVERRRLSLAQLLNKDVFEQKIICQHEVGNIGNEIRQEGVEVICLNHSLKNIFDVKQHRKIQGIIEDFQPDIIHGAVFEGVTMAAVNGFIKKVPVIIIEETSDPQNRSWKGNLLMKIFAKVSDMVIGVSEGVSEEYLKGKLGIPAKKVMFINNGVRQPRQVSLMEMAAERLKWGINDNDFVVGTMGRFKNDHHKRFSDLIEAFAAFSENKHNVKLLMVGGTEEYQLKYRQLAEELKVTDKIIFAGYQSDVTLFYQLMDVFALVSAYEAFGLVLAEAMLNRLPVLATRVGGMKYIVDDKETGYLVERYNVEEIAEKMEVLYLNKNHLTEMGEKGYVKAISEYTEEMYAKKVENLYTSLIARS